MSFFPPTKAGSLHGAGHEPWARELVPEVNCTDSDNPDCEAFYDFPEDKDSEWEDVEIEEEFELVEEDEHGRKLQRASWRKKRMRRLRRKRRKMRQMARFGPYEETLEGENGGG